jgi:hypothetical protein
MLYEQGVQHGAESNTDTYCRGFGKRETIDLYLAGVLRRTHSEW